MPTLIVRPPWAAQPAWTGVWVNERPADQGGCLMTWNQVNDLPPCHELVLAVPAALMSWHAVTLPKLAANRWRTALEGLLEDRLLVDVSQVHLALESEARGGQHVRVVACEKAWLEQSLQMLERAGRTVARIVPEFEPDDSGIYLLDHPERGWLVDCGPREVQCIPLSHPVHTALRTWRALHPMRLPRTEPGMAAAAEQAWGTAPQLHPIGEHLRQAATSNWNLAQFDLDTHRALHTRLARRLRHWWSEPEWRPMRWGLLCLAMLHLVGLQALAWKERSAQQAMQAEIRAVLTRSFPQIQLVIDPLLQMEREVQSLARSSGQASGSDLSRMLAALAGASNEPPAALDYKDGELTLLNWTPDPSQRARLDDDLRRKGYQLEASGPRWILRATGSKS